jgi:hypothetical protein
LAKDGGTFLLIIELFPAVNFKKFFSEGCVKKIVHYARAVDRGMISVALDQVDHPILIYGVFEAFFPRFHFLHIFTFSLGGSPSPSFLSGRRERPRAILPLSLIAFLPGDMACGLRAFQRIPVLTPLRK